MNKGKFASLILLGAFSAGVASSSAVRAQGDSNLASVVDNKSANSHDDSVSIDPKVSKEPVVAADETKIDTKTTTDEETQDDSTGDNSEAGINAKNIDDNPENKTDLPENLDKENKKDTDYIFVGDKKEDTDYIFVGDRIEKSEDDECKKIRLAKGIAVAGIGVSTIGIGAFGISKLVKSSGNDKNNKPSTDSDADPNPESDKPTGSEKEEKEPEKNPSEKPKKEKGGFREWYKNNLGVSIPLTLLYDYIFYAIVTMVVIEIMQQKDMRAKKADGIYLKFASEEDAGAIRPFFARLKNFTNKDRFKMDEDNQEFTITYSGLKRIGINAIAAFTFADYDWY